MHKNRIDLPPLPDRIKRLPVDERGYPVPFFVASVNGAPDFRVFDPLKMQQCVRERLCWVCGEILGRYRSYVIGPMCAINRISAEPPSHYECASFSAIACPFLSRPHMTRRDNLPEGTKAAPGVHILRNPGVTLLWVTQQDARPVRVGKGVLFELPEPERIESFKQGREATSDEIYESIESGFPALVKAAELDGADGLGCAWACDPSR
jgi:hypothetical protein